MSQSHGTPAGHAQSTSSSPQPGVFTHCCGESCSHVLGVVRGRHDGSTTGQLHAGSLSVHAQWLRTAHSQSGRAAQASGSRP